MTEALQATSSIMDARVLTVVGAYETHDKEGAALHGQPYETIGVQELMTIERTHVPKDKARWVLCSTYNGFDGRHHKVQEEQGRFVMLAVDIDSGNILGKELVKAVASFVGKSQFLVYSSSSATAINRKWRVLIPLAQEERFDTWLAIMVALNDHLKEALGVDPDRALERAGQPIYLPNSAPRMDGAKPMEASHLKEGELFNWRDQDEAADKVIAVLGRQEEERIEREKRQHEARQRMSSVASAGGERSVIDQFNESHDLANVLAACGYKPGPRDSWRSPLQSTSSHATKIHDDGMGQYWTSMSMSDFEAGIGRHTSDGRACFGDAFDVWCYFNAGNDRTDGIKAAADMLGIKPAPSPAASLADRIRANQAAANPTSQPKAQQPAQPQEPKEQQDDQPTGEVIEFPAPVAKPVAAWEPWEDAPSETPINPALAPASQPEADGPRLLSFVQASHLPNWEPPQELVEGMLIEGGMTVVYGDSNTGKSFLVLDMVAHISLGRPWFGKRVKKRAVVYLAAESPRSIMDRARALEEQLGTKLDDLFIVNCPIDLHDPNGDTAAVVDTIEAIERDFNVSIGCVVADTLARVMGGGDENKAIDMGTVVKHIDLIRAATQAQFVVVHHTGKDAVKGARGSSSLRAATDTEIEVSDPGNGNPKEFKVTKQRDLPGKNDVQGFTLTTVNLGVGVFDNLITTCVVEAAEAIPKDPTDSLKDGELEILDLLRGSTSGGLRYQQIIDQMQTVSIPTAKRYIRSLRKQGLIYEQSGQYRVGNGKTNGRQPGSEF
jgi:hypothetical protein